LATSASDRAQSTLVAEKGFLASRIHIALVAIVLVLGLE